MNDQDLQDFKKAGFIAGTARDYGKSLMKEGVLVVDVLDKVEEKIKSLGGGIAFPAQMSLNHVAAHTCSEANDETVIKASDVIKLDVGAHVNGLIGDTALTVNLDNQYKELLDASKKALNEALKVVRPGIEVGEIGQVIQSTILDCGFNPVRNLSGHGLGRFQIHTSPTIPNIPLQNSRKLNNGDTIAIEPFATDGKGSITESGAPTIFSVDHIGSVRSPIARQVLDRIKTYSGLPFASRWLTREFGVGKTRLAIRELTRAGIIYGHPALPEVTKGIVSQHEHSLYVSDKPIITTKLD